MLGPIWLIKREGQDRAPGGSRLRHRRAACHPAPFPIAAASIRPDPDDRCGKLIDEMIARHVSNEERILASLTRAEQEPLATLLMKLIAGL
jgi:hypothetical protein